MWRGLLKTDFGTALLALLAMAGALSLRAQVLQPKGPLPSFEVAAIKPWTPSAVVGERPAKQVPVGATPPVGDRVHFIGQIDLLIQAAYGLPVFSTDRIIGGPDWIRSESDRYEVTGKIDDAQYAEIQQMSPAQQHEQVSLMEQSFLADRLKFRAHFETREMPEYALVVAKGGSKMERAQAGARSQMSFVGNELRATAVSMEELAGIPFLRIGKRQIVDKTGLLGRFNFTLRFSNGLREDVTMVITLPNCLPLYRSNLVSSWFPKTDRWNLS